MKQLLPILVAILLFASCSKKKDVDPKNELHGTKWQAEDYSGLYFYGEVSLRVIHFIDNSAFEVYSTNKGDIVGHHEKGTYIKDGEKVYINYISLFGHETQLILTIVDGDTMKQQPYNGHYFKYKKVM